MDETIRFTITGLQFWCQMSATYDNKLTESETSDECKLGVVLLVGAVQRRRNGDGTVCVTFAS